MHRLGFLVLALLGALGCFASVQAAPVVTPYDLYEWGPVGEDGLEALRANPGGWQVLHQEERQGRTWMLLALPEGRSPSGIAGGPPRALGRVHERSEEHTSELQSQSNLVCRLLLE